MSSPFNRGVFLESQGDFDGAAAQFRAAVDDDPSDERARFNLALALESQAASQPRRESEGRGVSRTELLDRAEGHYLQLVQGDPIHLRAAINLAALWSDRGKAGQAYDLLERAQVAHPRSPWPATAMAARRLFAGDFGSVSKEPLGSLSLKALLERARSLDPQDPWVLWMSGIERERAGAEAEGVAFFSAGLAVAPRDLPLLVAMARLEGKRGHRAATEEDWLTAQSELTSAIGRLRLVWQLAPESYVAHRGLAQVLAWRGFMWMQRGAAAFPGGGRPEDERAVLRGREDLEAALVHHWAARDRAASRRSRWLDEGFPKVDHAAEARQLYKILGAVSEGAR